MVPIPNYPGAKGSAGTAQQIISQIPRCIRFIDALCGSATVGAKVYGCEVILNDLNKDTIDKLVYTSDENITVYNLDYREMISKYDLPGSVFYFDAPYLFETRKSKKPIYKYEWQDSDHSDFLQLVNRIKSPCIVSHYPCKMYDNALKNWRQVVFNSMTYGGLRKESIWMNFSPPVLLQCPDSVGNNFTDRQRIKRKTARLMYKLDKETPANRAAILSSIVNQFEQELSDLGKNLFVELSGGFHHPHT